MADSEIQQEVESEEEVQSAERPDPVVEQELQPQGLPSPPMENAIFVLTHFPLDPQYLPLLKPDQHWPISVAACMYYPALRKILSSRINRAGRVSSVLVNFDDDEWFIIYPQDYFFDDMDEFKFQCKLDQLFDTGEVFRDGTNRPVWTHLTDVFQFFINLMDEAHIVGCTSGARSAQPNVRHWNNLTFGPDNKPVKLFVIGNADEMISPFITEYVECGNGNATPEDMAATVCDALATRWTL